ncbi:MAG: DUF1592 domain-containing protein [Planctomycetota bacterium]
MTTSFHLPTLCLLCACLASPICRADETAVGSASLQMLLQQHCISCHSGTEPPGSLKLPDSTSQPTLASRAVWEKVLRRLQNGDMPPASEARPDPLLSRHATESLTATLDQLAARHPFPGPTETLRRLTRTEYRNAIRDLLAIEVDAVSLLPADESSQGFDNITVTGLSPTLLNRCIAAAEKISRLALGRPEISPGGETFRVPGDLTQDRMRPEGAPPGTRGGLVIDWHFPRTGTYEVRLRLMRDRNDEVEGLRGTHRLDLLLDRRRMQHFLIARPPSGQDDRSVDADLTASFHVTAGYHRLTATFADTARSLLESERQPLNVHFNFYRHPRLAPALAELVICGPLGDSSPGDSPSRRRVLTRMPADPTQSLESATEIFRPLLRRAYRRPISDEDLAMPLQLFRKAFAENQDFESGIERGLAGILASPQFLFRVEQQALPDSVGAASDLELASRLSFFLWSSLPDDQLLSIAEAGRLSQPDELRRQTARMLDDSRSAALAENFADQWLYLRNLQLATPDARLFPDVDQNLKDAFRRETELLFLDVLRDDRSVLSLLQTSSTWLNERLARHYGIPHVMGSHFRRVELNPGDRRGGLLRHGSVLMATSYATRTSPVLRGKWVLENLLGSPPPPPPPGVSDLQDNTVAAGLSVRARLAAHRENVACAICHDRIDPVGLALENYDAVGRWREHELEQPVVAAGGLAGVDPFVGVEGLEQALLARPELFVRTLAEKLLIYGLGRGLEPEDGAAVRKIVRQSATEDYRFSSLVQAIVSSVPFVKRE